MQFKGRLGPQPSTASLEATTLSQVGEMEARKRSQQAEGQEQGAAGMSSAGRPCPGQILRTRAQGT